MYGYFKRGHHPVLIQVRGNNDGPVGSGFLPQQFENLFDSSGLQPFQFSTVDNTPEGTELISRQEALRLTAKLRPDLMEKAVLDDRDREFLATLTDSDKKD